MLCELMGVNREDEEFVLQIAHSLSPLLMHEATRTVLLENTQVHLFRCSRYEQQCQSYQGEHMKIQHEPGRVN